MVDAEQVQKTWQEYLATLPAKRRIIADLALLSPNTPEGRIRAELRDLQNLLNTGLVDIQQEERTVGEIITDIDSIGHRRTIKRVQNLEYRLRYEQTKYEYVYRMLEHLHKVLKAQMHIVQKMIVQLKYFSVPASLQRLMTVEDAIVEKIREQTTFPILFSQLLTGEHIIQRMEQREQKLFKRMQNGMQRVFANEVTEGVTREWALTVFNGMENWIQESVAKGRFEFHPDVDMEFVHSTEFITYCEVCLRRARTKPRPVSREMLNVFVQLFRAWYDENARRE